MSRDTVDDLHLAEDTLGVLRDALDALIPHLNRLPSEIAKQVLQAIDVGDAYCRCEEDEDGVYLCDADCGCPADHEMPHHPESP